MSFFLSLESRVKISESLYCHSLLPSPCGSRVHHSSTKSPRCHHVFQTTTSYAKPGQIPKGRLWSSGFPCVTYEPPVWHLPHCSQLVCYSFDLFPFLTIMFLNHFLRICLGDGHASLWENNEDDKSSTLGMGPRFHGPADSQLTWSVVGCGLRDHIFVLSYPLHLAQSWEPKTSPWCVSVRGWINERAN